MGLDLEEIRRGAIAAVKAARAKQRKARRDFLHLEGFTPLAAYVVKHHAEKALPLLLVIYRRLLMYERKDLALTAPVWANAGNPSQQTRKTVLALLRRMPDLITIREARNFTYRYRIAKGPLWHTFETTEPAGDEEPDIANDDDA